MIMAGTDTDKPVFQVLRVVGISLLNVEELQNIGKYKLTATDGGKKTHDFLVMANNLNGLFTSGMFSLNSVVQINRYIVKQFIAQEK
jgi:hypothetical protein